MKLYYMPGTCSLADHIVLEWIGKPYEAKRMSHDELKSPAYLKLNPNGAVPVLEDGDFVLTQNAAILNYLADLNPQSRLGGDGTPKSRAEINRWLAFVNADVHPAFAPLFGATAYLDNPAAVDKTKDAARTKLRDYFEKIDAQLVGRDWLVGERSIADPYLFVTLRWARKFGVDLSGLGNIEGFMQHMEDNVEVRKVMAAERSEHA
ncbi:MAG: glutathione binding-like protein [Dokdonella sp.]